MTQALPKTAIGVDVVVVEDDSDDARITCRGLKRVLPTPTIAVIGDGEAAVQHLLETSASSLKLVVLDLKLPKVHGLDVLAVIRSTQATKDTPVMVLTSSDEPRDVSRAKELGASAYITKPVDWQEYIRRVCMTAASLLPDSECAG